MKCELSFSTIWHDRAKYVFNEIIHVKTLIKKKTKMDTFILNIRWGNYSRVDNRLSSALGYCITYARVHVNVYREWPHGCRGWGCWKLSTGVRTGHGGWDPVRSRLIRAHFSLIRIQACLNSLILSWCHVNWVLFFWYYLSTTYNVCWYIEF